MTGGIRVEVSLTGAVAWRGSVCGLRLTTLPAVLCDLNDGNLVDIKQQSHPHNKTMGDLLAIAWGFECIVN